MQVYVQLHVLGCNMDQYCRFESNHYSFIPWENETGYMETRLAT